jgi:hypothetical protein
VLALELVELGVDFLRCCFLDVHISHDRAALRMRTFDTPEDDVNIRSEGRMVST